MKTGFGEAWFGKVAEINQQRAETGKLYREFLRVPEMSAGLYVLAAGATDSQRPHHEDEMYYVVRGKARFQAGDQDRQFPPAACSSSQQKLSTISTISPKNWPYWSSSRPLKARS